MRIVEGKGKAKLMNITATQNADYGRKNGMENYVFARPYRRTTDQGRKGLFINETKQVEQDLQNSA